MKANNNLKKKRSDSVITINEITEHPDRMIKLNGKKIIFTKVLM